MNTDMTRISPIRTSFGYSSLYIPLVGVFFKMQLFVENVLILSLYFDTSLSYQFKEMLRFSAQLKVLKLCKLFPELPTNRYLTLNDGTKREIKQIQMLKMMHSAFLQDLLRK